MINTRYRFVFPWLLLLGVGFLAAADSSRGFEGSIRGSVQGKVLNGDSPLDGAEVRLFPVPTSVSGCSPSPDAEKGKPLAHSRTDSNGDFWLDLPWIDFWIVQVRAQGYSSREYLLPPAEGNASLPTLSLLQARPLRVVVSDELGRPIMARIAVSSSCSGKRVQGEWIDSTVLSATDEAGEAFLWVSPRERQGNGKELLKIEIAAPGLVPVRRPLTSRENLEISLQAGREHRVRAVDYRGQPVPGTRAYLHDGVLPLGEAEPSGRMQVSAPKELAQGLTFVSPGGLHGSLVGFPVGEEEALQRVVLAKASRLQGRILEMGSRSPVAGAFVWAVGGFHPTVATTDSRGRFSLPFGRQERVRLSTMSPWHVPSAGIPADGNEVELLLQPLRRGVGIVLDSSGREIPDAKVRLLPSDRPSVAPSAAPSVESPFLVLTDEVGRFLIANPPPGSFKLQISAAGFRTHQVREGWLQGGNGEFDLGSFTLKAEGPLEGWVSDSSGRGLEGVEVFAIVGGREPSEWPMVPPVSRARSDATGYFVLGGLGEGETYDLWATKAGFLRSRKSGIEISTTTSLDFRLEEAAAVSGWVVSDGGRAVEGALVTIEPVVSQSIGAKAETELPGKSALTDAGGAFEISGLPLGSLILTAEAGGYESGQATVSEVRGGETRSGIEIPIRPGLALSGVVLTDSGQEVAGATVWARGLEGEPRQSFTRADDQGRFQLLGLAPGPWNFDAVDSQGRSASKTFEVVEDNQALELIVEEFPTVSPSDQGDRLE